MLFSTIFTGTQMSTGHVTITNIKYIPVSSDIEGFGFYPVPHQQQKQARNFHIIVKILSKDDKFMKAAQDIYDNRHKGIERGYEKLTNSN
jgi:hypothetical protein